MARIIPDGFGEVAWVLTSAQGTDPFVTTMGVQLINGIPENYVDFANKAFTAYADTMLTKTTDALTLDRVELSVGLGNEKTGSVLSDLPSEQGTVGAQMAPIGMAAIGRKNSATLGRKGRGRCFFPGVLTSDDVSLGGSLEPTARAALSTEFNQLLDILDAGGDSLAMPTYILHTDPTEIPTLITGGSIAPVVGWIRKRVY